MPKDEDQVEFVDDSGRQMGVILFRVYFNIHMSNKI